MLSPNTDLEKLFYINAKLTKIDENRSRLAEMRKNLAMRGRKVNIELVQLDGGEEAVLVIEEGKEEGAAVMVDDLMSGAVTLQMAVDEVIGDGSRKTA
jgi:hypothetical protein